MATTWDPANSSGTPPSNANLTIGSGTFSRTVFVGGSSSLLYFEAKISAVGTSGTAVGFCNGTFTIGTDPSASPNAITAWTDGNVYANNVTLGAWRTGAPAANDVICVAIDTTNKTFWARDNSGNWNNSGTANPATNTGGYAIPNAGPYYGTGDVSDTNTLTLQAAAFTVPSGFTDIMAASAAGMPAGVQGDEDDSAADPALFDVDALHWDNNPNLAGSVLAGPPQGAQVDAYEDDDDLADVTALEGEDSQAVFALNPGPIAGAQADLYEDDHDLQDVDALDGADNPNLAGSLLPGPDQDSQYDAVEEDHDLQDVDWFDWIDSQGVFTNAVVIIPGPDEGSQYDAAEEEQDQPDVDWFDWIDSQAVFAANAGPDPDSQYDAQEEDHDLQDVLAFEGEDNPTLAGSPVAGPDADAQYDAHEEDHDPPDTDPFIGEDFGVPQTVNAGPDADAQVDLYEEDHELSDVSALEGEDSQAVQAQNAGPDADGQYDAHEELDHEPTDVDALDWVDSQAVFYVFVAPTPGPDQDAQYDAAEEDHDLQDWEYHDWFDNPNPDAVGPAPVPDVVPDTHDPGAYDHWARQWAKAHERERAKGERKRKRKPDPEIVRDIVEDLLPPTAGPRLVKRVSDAVRQSLMAPTLPAFEAKVDHVKALIIQAERQDEEDLIALLMEYLH